MRAARALLGIDQKQLAKPTIQRMEASEGKLLRDSGGGYDYYGYVEDDIVVVDPMFLHKRRLFDRTFGPYALLQPNRYRLPPLRRSTSAMSTIGLIHASPHAFRISQISRRSNCPSRYRHPL
jgi:hypothetical protein